MTNSNIRIIDDEQRQRLLAVHRQVNAELAPRLMLDHLAAEIGRIVSAKVAFVGKREGRWVVLAEAAGTHRLPPAGDRAWQSFAQVAGELGRRVELWRHDDIDWTLVGLRRRRDAPVVMIVQGDWTLSASVLLQCARSLAPIERKVSRPSHVHLGVAVHRLTRALARVTGEREVCEVVLRHLVRAVPSRIAAFALPSDENGEQLTIAATYGYPRLLVEHVRIAPGAGIIGSVYRNRTPLHVEDVAAFLSRQPRPRYTTNSFVALPVSAGNEVLGVVAITDRADGSTFTADDLAALRVLVAPAALALARERQRRHAESFAHAAAVDPVSGLYNRRFFQTRLEQELQRAVRQSAPLSVLMIDLDNFKSINDDFGHLAGDAVIADVAQILRRSVRVFDVCARFGGDEFAILMPGNPVDSATTTAERILERIQSYRPADPALADLRVTASVGIGVAAEDAQGRYVVERADRALYAAKRRGKNQLQVESPASGARGFGGEP